MQRNVNACLGTGEGWPERVSGHEGQSQRRDHLPGIGVRIAGQLPALPEEGLSLAAEVLVVDAHLQIAVAGDARPGQVVAAEDYRPVVDEDQLI